MGKSKKRSLHLGINNMITNITREEALDKVLLACMQKKLDENTKNLITLFGFTCEDLLEKGVAYEDVLGLKPLLK
jgi:hypothetical protein